MIGCLLHPTLDDYGCLGWPTGAFAFNDISASLDATPVSRSPSRQTQWIFSGISMSWQVST